MDIEIFSLCDAATEQGGKLSLLGSFDSIYAKATQAPIVHPDCSLVLRIRFSRIEYGAHSLRARIITYDGKDIVSPLETGIRVDFGTSDLDYFLFNSVIRIRDLTFPGPGKYRIDLAVDGKLERQLPLTVATV
ncbi:MAG: hypothetical protein H0X38_13540 [Planctomycetes bacterium]|jgi:hypothetical protein|nr:hypothetical protein [Planctomycetota bacterium]